MNAWIFSLVLVAFTVVSNAKTPTPKKTEKSREAASTQSSPSKPEEKTPGTRAVPESEADTESDWEPAPAPTSDDE